ncbi:MAG: peptidoglycan DD-metalloendopeptidase family protein [Desulfurivibrio sp.]|nr:peptidoglycan DD-metalloendopeptidase family protein [Desulfurivibrio sp.]
MKFFVNSTHFPTVAVAVTVVTAALLFANITPASLPDRPEPLAYSPELPAVTVVPPAPALRPTTAPTTGKDAGWPEDYTLIDGQLQSGDSLNDTLRRGQLTTDDRRAVIDALAGLLDFRSLRPGDRFQVVLDEHKELVEYRYQSGPLETYRVYRQADHRLQAEKMAVQLTRRTKQISGRIDSSLLAAFRPHGEKPRLAYAFAEIFASRFDFNVEIRRGDSYELVFEKYYHDEQFVGYGRLLKATYRRANGEVLTAFHYETKNTASHFDPEGRELGASFLRSPVPVARVTSGFTYARRHPILDQTRPHLAVDLAAPRGTPVMASADGRVVFRRRDGGNGNMVTIDHGNGYRSSYAHLNRFRKGLQVGDRVQQKDIIGYIGATGLATGPHVCYRIQKNGRYVDPMGLEFKPRSVLEGAELAAFRQHRQEITQLAAELADGPRVVKSREITVEPDQRLTML